MKTMLKKLRIPPSSSWHEFSRISSRVSRISLYSTQTLAPNATNATLYQRLLRLRDPSVTPVLDQWVEEGRPIDQQDLHRSIKQLRKFRRYKHALQICQWMNNKPYLNVSHKDVSVELDLISKVHGLKQAEEYFNKIPNPSRVWQVYGSLLNCYANAKNLQKAESIMDKMRELGYSHSLTYNVMMGLYSDMKKYEKVDLLMEEMEQKGIPIDKFTYGIRLNAYAQTLETPKMEKLLMKMEADPEVLMEWHAYTTVANGYLKAGDQENAIKSLKKAEFLIRPSQKKPAYEILLTLYASAGIRDEVFRMWNLYKKLGKFYNHGYLCMLSSLSKMDCMDDIERVYAEWEAGFRNFDIQVPNLLVTIYGKKGFLEKAENLVKKLVESGKGPDGSTWSRMALAYFKKGLMDKAVEAVRKAVSGGYSGWMVDTATLSACLEYLNENGDLDEAEGIIRLLKEKGHLSEAVYKGIVKNLSKSTRI